VDSVNDSPVTQLGEEEAWQLLGSQEVGRLATTAGGVLDIFPITYVVDGKTIVFRTGPGTKLVELTINEHVVFEIDHYDESEGYSVIVHGVAEQMEHMGEIDYASTLPLLSLFPTEKPRFVRIYPERISGRRFRRS
jgi:nitroimidazol reductase NimA-like FMN-containing flavoprotein (pyridoxamine 5'-phosphate oxidase superfamily)